MTKTWIHHGTVLRFLQVFNVKHHPDHPDRIKRILWPAWSEPSTLTMTLTWSCRSLSILEALNGAFQILRATATFCTATPSGEGLFMVAPNCINPTFSQYLLVSNAFSIPQLSLLRKHLSFLLAQLLFAIDPRLILQMFDRILPIQRTIHGGQRKSTLKKEWQKIWKPAEDQSGSQVP